MLPNAASFDLLESIIKEPLKVPLPVHGYLHTELSARRSVVTAALETMVGKASWQWPLFLSQSCLLLV